MKNKLTLKLFKWGYGKHKTGYRVFTFIYSKYLKLDYYAIHYCKGTSIPKHKDPIIDGKMYRLNIEIWKAKKGGKFNCESTIFSIFDRIILFRPDINEHYVTPVEEGNRWVLSLGKLPYFGDH